MAEVKAVRRPVKEEWLLEGSTESKSIVNPIRDIVDGRKLEQNPQKNLVSLSIGDPTVFGNLPVHDVMKQAVKDAVDSGTCNGYGPAQGLAMTRRAVAAHYSTPEAPLTEDDVIMSCGCSGALDMCITVLGNPGQNILIPRPGFGLYSCLSVPRGIEARHYDLVPDRQWEIDLDHLEQLIDANTVSIVVTNPSNPCGSVYSKKHLLDILAVAERHFLPIIGDEIYDGMVFKGQQFYSLASLSKNVPILSCGGIAKRYLVPGWRVGWILIYDKNETFKKEIFPCLLSTTRKILGPSTILQAALPDILAKVPQSYFKNTMNVVEANANAVYSELSAVPGLKPVMPSGAMYMMVGIDLKHFPNLNTAVDFMEKLMSEQSVFCLPGEVHQWDQKI
ncbi:tyrosine aminotransferase-like isoform X2 [Dysidea avara]|uniref:tyrosine aminotransferase-like isoform X2 n=1 Tax=Dysidea avara TaxID=196820 RepID=UPI0033321CC4